jgi:mannan endo-1,4-beta-mannosidase
VSAGRAGVAIVIASAALLAGCGKFAPIGQASPRPSRSSQSQPARPAATASAPAAYNMSGLLDPLAGKFLGVEANGAPDSLASVDTFAAAVGHKPDLIGQYIGWGSPFDAHAAAAAWSYGALYYMSWEPYGTSVAAIASGQSNAYIARFAAAVRALNVPVAISFGHEMNGNWYPWGTTGTTPAQFVTAWQLIHGIFAGVGATNVIWVWNPNDIYPVPHVQLGPYWPGDSYVDWVGITGYVAATGPDTFATLFQPTMDEIRQFTSKPFIIAETSVQTGPSDITGVGTLVQTVTGNPDVLGLVWFDYDKDGVDWRIESRPAIQAAFAQDIAGLQVVDPRQ